MRRYAGHLVACCAVLFFVALPVHAEEEELAVKLKAIRASVETAESDIARMKDEFNALLAKRQEIEATLKKIKEDDRAIQKKVSELAIEQEKLSADVIAAEKHASLQQIKIEARLRAMYVNASVSVSPVFLGNAARGDLERLSLYARKIRDLDSRLFKAATDAVAALLKARAKLTESMATEERLREELRKKRNDAEAESEKFKGVTEELIEKQKAAQASLALLQSEAKKVEDMIASLTSGDEDEEVVEPEPEAPAVSEEAQEPSRDTEKPPLIQKTVLHPSLFDPSVTASAPVKGEILHGFGRTKMTNFADMVRSKGIEFSSPIGAPVYSVLQGKVVFAGLMPGYDQVVVVEHGGRSFSLYGRLGSVDVHVGDQVAQDHPLATTSSPDAKGRNYYFEIRKAGAPVNPEAVLRRVSR
jgi:septal ring factor EnvC (AmiA/AmiB activator)